MLRPPRCLRGFFHEAAAPRGDARDDIRHLVVVVRRRRRGRLLLIARRCARRRCPRHRPRGEGRHVSRRVDDPPPGLELVDVALDELVVAGELDLPRAAAPHLLDDTAHLARVEIARGGTRVEGQMRWLATRGARLGGLAVVLGLWVRPVRIDGLNRSCVNS